MRPSEFKRCSKIFQKSKEQAGQILFRESLERPEEFSRVLCWVSRRTQKSRSSNLKNNWQLSLLEWWATEIPNLLRRAFKSQDGILFCVSSTDRKSCVVIRIKSALAEEPFWRLLMAKESCSRTTLPWKDRHDGEKGGWEEILLLTLHGDQIRLQMSFRTNNSKQTQIKRAAAKVPNYRKASLQQKTTIKRLLVAINRFYTHLEWGEGLWDKEATGLWCLNTSALRPEITPYKTSSR